MKRGAVGDIDLHAYLDGELDPARAADVRRHLAAHPGDAKRVERWRKQNEAIRRAFEITREPSLPARAADSAPKREPQRDPLGALRLDHARLLRRRRQALATSAGFIAGAAVALFAAASFERRLFSVPTADIVSQAPSIAAKRARLAWRTFAPQAGLFAGRSEPNRDEALRHSPRPPDFAAEGFRLASAHPMPGEAEPAVFFLYEAASGARVGLIAERSAGPDARPILDDDGGLRCLHWRGGGHAWTLVGQAGPDTLRALGRAAGSGV